MEAPRLPAWRPKAVAGLRKRLASAAEPHWGDLRASGALALARDWGKLLDRCDPDALVETIRLHLVSWKGKFQYEQSRRLAWRIAANLDRLENGDPLGPWSGEPDDHWCVARLQEVWDAAGSEGRPPGLLLRWQVHLGPATGQVASVSWMIGKLGSFARRHCKPGRRSERYKHPLQLVGIFAFAMVRALREEEAENFAIAPVRLAQFDTSEAMKASNRATLSARLRKYAPCPHGLSYGGAPHPCYDRGGAPCPVGPADCAFAVLPESPVEIERCRICGNPGWSRDGSDVCFFCWRRARSLTPWFQEPSLG